VAIGMIIVATDKVSLATAKKMTVAIELPIATTQ
jgi:hypothetical protein